MGAFFYALFLEVKIVGRANYCHVTGAVSVHA